MRHIQRLVSQVRVRNDAEAVERILNGQADGAGLHFQQLLQARPACARSDPSRVECAITYAVCWSC